MDANEKGAYAMLAVLLLASLLAFLNGALMEIPGLLEFEAADFLLSFFLPTFNGEYLLEIGAIYGRVWPLLMAGVYAISVNRNVPDKWKRSPKTYKAMYLAILTAVMSTILALLLHLHGVSKNH